MSSHVAEELLDSVYHEVRHEQRESQQDDGTLQRVVFVEAPLHTEHRIGVLRGCDEPFPTERRHEDPGEDPKDCEEEDDERVEEFRREAVEREADPHAAGDRHETCLEPHLGRELGALLHEPSK